MDLKVCEPMFTATHTCPVKYCVHQGGTSSAKTYTILQSLAVQAAETPNLIITVVGQDVPNLKKGAIRDLSRIFQSSIWLQMQVPNYKLNKGYNKTERIYEFNNGSIIEFNSYDNEQDAKSGKRDILFVNEANGIDYMIFWQLAIRTRLRVYIDYNPTARFWAHDHVIGKPNVKLYISDHRHNGFLSKELHDEIENNPDKELWRVYARGLTGQIHGLIYTKYKLIDEMPMTWPRVLGLDFGYNHKTALIDVAFEPGKLAWDELIYQSEITIGDLIPMMKELNIGKKLIYADHQAADKIEDLRRAGFNVHKADKDVKNGIDWVKRNSLYITKRSLGIRKEVLGYKWKEDKNTHKPTDEPVKFMDDAVDAGRYGSYTGFRKPKGYTVADDTTLPWYKSGDGGETDLLDAAA
jgi:phage terminase large subunit